jgi:hypothetical protein
LVFSIPYLSPFLIPELLGDHPAKVIEIAEELMGSNPRKECRLSNHGLNTKGAIAAIICVHHDLNEKLTVFFLFIFLRVLIFKMFID